VEGPVAKTYSVSKTFHAPLDFVYSWCTDFRADDNKMVGSNLRRHFFERSPRRYVWLLKRKVRKKTIEGLRVVWLTPPDSWRLSTCGDKFEEGTYKLTPVGKRTRLDMTFRVIYEDPKKVPSTRELVSGDKNDWNSFAKYLEKDYQAFAEKQAKRKR